jgi:hypothetical protein
MATCKFCGKPLGETCAVVKVTDTDIRVPTCNFRCATFYAGFNLHNEHPDLPVDFRYSIVMEHPVEDNPEGEPSP